jgi:shikimate kinase
MQGSIDVQAIISQCERQNADIKRLFERQERDRLRREEQMVLRKYYQADEAVRRTIVSAYPDVFARLGENRRKAAAIAKAERAEADRLMREQGYVIRPGGGCPRYVRTTWSGVISGEWQPERRTP